MRAWYISLEMTGVPSARVLTELAKSHITAREITADGDRVTLSVRMIQLRAVRRFAASLGAEVRETERGFLAAAVKGVLPRSGLLIGAAAWAAFMFVAKDYALSIRVLTDDERIRADVLRLLAENGCPTGAYIPDLDKAGMERLLKQKAEGVSWAGISITDSTLIVDVYGDDPQPQMFYDRMPSDLVATRDAVVGKIEVLDGQLVTTMGSGVVRGDKLVSGRIPVTKKVVKDDPVLGRVIAEEQSEKYVRSLGKIYGVYTDVQTFEQPLAETSLVHTGSTLTLKRLRVFGMEIPLYAERPQGYSTVSEGYSPLTLFGEETPVGVASEECELCSFSTVRYTPEQAAERTRRLKQLYEQNFLSECEIRSCSEQLETADDRVRLTVTYEIYGLISEEKQFFIKK